ncbi:MAG: hypothetical protein BWY09_01657 [Candidatus Hydrogenedentes bacterium ADurb.Bin179]|nr:MAG: hypothetical protein BWY09_01657 [Candidatus Hydrogenedentes bacterium ADurb.Bin179]
MPIAVHFNPDKIGGDLSESEKEVKHVDTAGLRLRVLNILGKAQFLLAGQIQKVTPEPRCRIAAREIPDAWVFLVVTGDAAQQADAVQGRRVGRSGYVPQIGGLLRGLNATTEEGPVLVLGVFFFKKAFIGSGGQYPPVKCLGFAQMPQPQVQKSACDKAKDDKRQDKEAMNRFRHIRHHTSLRQKAK